MSSLLLQRSAAAWHREGLRGVIRGGVQALRARWQLRRATRVGAVRLWGNVRVVNQGDLVVEDRVRMDGSTVRIDLACGPGALLCIGEGTYINYGTSIGAVRSVEIGRDCMIGQYTIIMDSDQHDPLDHGQPHHHDAFRQRAGPAHRAMRGE